MNHEPCYFTVTITIDGFWPEIDYDNSNLFGTLRLHIEPWFV